MQNGVLLEMSLHAISFSGDSYTGIQDALMCATLGEALAGKLGIEHVLTALLADGRKYFRCNPVLESLGALELAWKNQGVEAWLVDEEGKLLSAEGIDDVTSGYVILFYMLGRPPKTKRQVTQYSVFSK